MPMSFRALMRYSLASLCAVVFVAAVQAQPAAVRGAPGSPWPAVQPAVQLASTAIDDYRLGPGDTLGVLVFQNPDLSLDVRVSESGLISYPLIGSLAVGGQTLIEAQMALAQALRSGGYVRDPQVSLVLRQIRGNQVSVLGQVSRPGRFALEAFSTRVSDMLAAAGGITSAGDDWLVVTGSREGRPFRKEIDVPSLFGPQPSSDDIVLAPGDTLYVGKAPQFYIDGQAQKPGAHRLERGMTVRQALAAGGGPTARGSQNRLRVHRKDAQGRLVEAVPQMNDLVRPDDVIHVGESLF
jgi:polysaccharide export outer membrane protein